MALLRHDDRRRSAACGPRRPQVLDHRTGAAKALVPPPAAGRERRVLARVTARSADPFDPACEQVAHILYTWKVRDHRADRLRGVVRGHAVARLNPRGGARGKPIARVHPVSYTHLTLP